MFPVLQFRALRFCAYIVGVCAIPSITLAANINYGDYVAPTFVFKNVTEGRAGSQPLLFGVPKVAGNSLQFTPPDFGAVSKLGVPDLVDSHLSVTIASQGGAGISSVKLDEFGDFTLVPSLSGTGLAQVSVSTPAFLTILAVNGATISPFRIDLGGTFTPSLSGLMKLPDYPVAGTRWEGGFQFDVAGALRDHGYANAVATEVLLDFDNTLTAASESSTIALIMKKGASIEVSTQPTQPVPEPSTVASLVLAGACLGWLGWRRGKGS